MAAFAGFRYLRALSSRYEECIASDRQQRGRDFHRLGMGSGVTKLVSVATCILLTSGAGTAIAGCANYVDGSMSEPAPKVTICFAGKCTTATKLYECQNVNGSVSAYETDAGEWEFSSSDESKTRRVRRNGVALTDDQIASLACIPHIQRGGNSWDCFDPVMKSEGDYLKSRKHQS